MKILIVTHNSRVEGNTSKLINEFISQCNDLGKDVNLEYDVLDLKSLDIKPCTGCKACFKGSCIIKDDISNVISSINDYDGIILSSPVYFFSFTGTLKIFIDRLYATNLTGMQFAVITSSGSEFFEGGSDLLVEMMKRTCNYCGSEWKGIVQKTTDDLILPLTDIDIENIRRLIDSLVDNQVTGSCFIRD